MSGIPAWAYRGAKVAFVGSDRIDAADRGFKIDARPAKDTPYTIREGRIGRSGDYYIRLNEMQVDGVDPNGRPFLDGWIGLRAFRPLITQQDDISTHFAQYLNAPLKPVREGV